jgi:hypothetical protein
MTRDPKSWTDVVAKSPVCQWRAAALLNLLKEPIQEDAPSITYVFSMPPSFSNLTRSTTHFNDQANVGLFSASGST